MGFTVTVMDNTHLNEQLPQLHSNIITLTAAKGEGILTEETPYDTGHLQRSWRTSTGKNQIKFINSAEYARYVNDGRGKVVVKKAKALKFVKGGKIIGFAKSAKATKGQHFVETSLERLENEMHDVLMDALDKL